MESVDIPHETYGATPAQVARTMLDMFSAIPPPAPNSLGAGSAHQRALWIADALHRANNLSQMSLSLGTGGMRRRFALSADDQVVQARALSRAYAELGVADTTDRDVPCLPLLEVIAMRLIALFGEARAIRLHVAADHVLLSTEKRRALTLIASELIINALKYAFPSGTSGVIAIGLTRWPDRIELSVADDGCGLPDTAGTGAGTALMQQLTALLDADIRRFSSDGGLKVVVSVPDRIV